MLREFNLSNWYLCYYKNDENNIFAEISRTTTYLSSVSLKTSKIVDRVEMKTTAINDQVSIPFPLHLCIVPLYVGAISNVRNT